MEFSQYASLPLLTGETSQWEAAHNETGITSRNPRARSKFNLFWYITGLPILGCHWSSREVQCYVEPVVFVNGSGGFLERDSNTTLQYCLLPKCYNQECSVTSVSQYDDLRLCSWVMQWRRINCWEEANNATQLPASVANCLNELDQPVELIC